MTLIVFGIAWLGATGNCQDGCPVGSPWAPGAWGSVVQFWGLAVPALIAMCSLVTAIATGRRRTSLVTWVLMTALLAGWVLFTAELSGITSPALWVAGLLVACAGGLPGVMLAAGD